MIQAHEASSQVIMNNCIRCHTQLNTEFVKTGKIDYMLSQVGEGKGLLGLSPRCPSWREELAVHGSGSYCTASRIARAGMAPKMIDNKE